MDFSPGSENRKILNQDFYQNQYAKFREWYFANHNPKQLQEIKIQYYQYLEESQNLYPFPLWFMENGNIPNPQLNILENIQKQWITTDGSIITSIHPPAKSLELLPSDSTTQPLVISAFVEPPAKSNNALTVREIIPVMKHNNYTNLFYQTMGKQLTRIEEIIYHIKDNCQIQPKLPDIKPVAFKPTPTVTNFNLKPKKDNT